MTISFIIPFVLLNTVFFQFLTESCLVLFKVGPLCYVQNKKEQNPRTLLAYGFYGAIIFLHKNLFFFKSAGISRQSRLVSDVTAWFEYLCSTMHDKSAITSLFHEFYLGSL